jgi:hypothetical protein
MPIKELRNLTSNIDTNKNINAIGEMESRIINSLLSQTQSQIKGIENKVLKISTQIKGIENKIINPLYFDHSMDEFVGKNGEIITDVNLYYLDLCNIFKQKAEFFESIGGSYWEINKFGIRQLAIGQAYVIEFEGDCSIHTIKVIDDWQKKDVGKFFLNLVESEIKKLNYKKVQLTSLPGVEGFYYKNGYFATNKVTSHNERILEKFL